MTHFVFWLTTTVYDFYGMTDQVGCAILECGFQALPGQRVRLLCVCLIVTSSQNEVQYFCCELKNVKQDGDLMVTGLVCVCVTFVYTQSIGVLKGPINSHFMKPTLTQESPIKTFLNESQHFVLQATFGLRKLCEKCERKQSRKHGHLLKPQCLDPKATVM